MRKFKISDQDKYNVLSKEYVEKQNALLESLNAIDALKDEFLDSAERRNLNVLKASYRKLVARKMLKNEDEIQALKLGHPDRELAHKVVCKCLYVFATTGLHIHE